MVRLGFGAEDHRGAVTSHCMGSGHGCHSDLGDPAEVVLVRCLPWKVGLVPSPRCALQAHFPGKEVTAQPTRRSRELGHPGGRGGWGYLHRECGMRRAFVCPFPFLCLFILRERARMEGAEKEGERENPKQALCCQSRARRGTRTTNLDQGLS